MVETTRLIGETSGGNSDQAKKKGLEFPFSLVIPSISSREVMFISAPILVLAILLFMTMLGLTRDALEPQWLRSMLPSGDGVKPETITPASVSLNVLPESRDPPTPLRPSVSSSSCLSWGSSPPLIIGMRVAKLRAAALRNVSEVCMCGVCACEVCVCNVRVEAEQGVTPRGADACRVRVVEWEQRPRALTLPLASVRPAAAFFVLDADPVTPFPPAPMQNCDQGTQAGAGVLQVDRNGVG